MTRLTPLATLALLLLVPGCAQREGMGRDGHAADVPAARVTGEALSCLPLASARESTVRDDWTIDFRVAGNRYYRNTLPHRCSGLGFERAFSYATSLNALCSLDIIHVIDSAGGGTRGGCGLGRFVPVELEPRRK